MVFDLGRQVATIESDQDVRPALSSAVLVIGQPGVDDQRGTLGHRRERAGDGFRRTERGADDHRTGVRVSQQ